uniref:Uncharacterized protein n=1 Tax=Noctiluca scintillans TaxID=2966 RepID=A0A7S1F6I8_NOCSC
MPVQCRRRVSEQEARHRWSRLSYEQRLESTRFDDPVLVQRIRDSLQELFGKQRMMREWGILLDTTDPFESSSLLTTAFEFTWMIGRSSSQPDVVMVNPGQMPVMAVKAPMLTNNSLFDTFREVLPDFMKPSGRVPLPRARWKEFWASEPSSICAMERQLAKLMEQAMWAMGADPIYAFQTSDADPHELEEWASDIVRFEPWMEGETQKEEKKKLKKKKKKTGKRTPVNPLEPTAEEMEPETPCDDAVEGEAHHGLFDNSVEEVCNQSTQPPCDTKDTLLSPSVEEEWCVREIVDEEYPICLNTQRERCYLPPLTMPPVGRLETNPPELICYIWNQVSQWTPRDFDADCDVSECSPSCGANQSCPLSRTTAPPSPLASSSTGVTARGQWMRAPSTGTVESDSSNWSVVVRNTFLDVSRSGFSTPPPPRCSRSLSPSVLRSLAVQEDPLASFSLDVAD